MSGFTLSDEQQTIVDYVHKLLDETNDTDSIAIKAFAGCGKSFVLKYIANQFKNNKFLGLAFNSSIVKENKKEFPKRNSVWLSVHGLSREYLKKNNVKIDFANARGEYKIMEIIDILSFKDRGEYKLAKSINLVFKVFCQSSLKKITPEGIQRAAKSQKNLETISMNTGYLNASCEKAIILWKLFEENKIAPTFDYYLKYFEVNQFAKKIKEFDVIQLDEAQDSNAVTMSIISQIPAKKIFVGDEHQSIYGFRGTINALNYADRLFYLSSTYRYIPTIADFANKILKGYKLEKKPIKSNATGTSNDKKRAYLCRNNATMIAMIEQFIKAGKEFITVKDPDDLFTPSISMLQFRINEPIESKDYNWLKKFKDIEEVEDYIEESNDNDLKGAFKMQQRYGRRLYVLKSQAKKYFKSKKSIKYVLSTAHTSKGLEWDEVELMHDFPDIQELLEQANIETAKDLMTKYDKGDLDAYQIIQEINLYYVAVTRARYKVI